MYRRITRLLNVLTCMSLLFTVITPIHAHGKAPFNSTALTKKIDTNVYVVFMAQDPATFYKGDLRGLAATKPQKGKKFNARSAQVVDYRNFLKREHDSALQAAGVRIDKKIYDYSAALNGFAAVMTAQEAAKLAQQPDVAIVLKDEMRFKTTDASPGFLELDSPNGPWTQRVNGEGVIVGVIDTGIWPEHPSFVDDGSYKPLDMTLDNTVGDPCKFGNTSHNPQDKSFKCNNKLIGARQFMDTYRTIVGIGEKEFDSARDDNGHGTHTASTAAGNSDIKSEVLGMKRGIVSGIAPRARVIAYKGLGELGGFTSDLAAAIDQAVADGCDVINYSVGGGASLIGADDIAYLFAADAGVFVAASAGNNGPDPATINGPASVPWITAVGANTHNRAFISKIKLKGPGIPPWDIWGGSVSVTKDIKGFNLVDAEGIADVEGDMSGQCLNAFPEATFRADDVVLCNQYDFGTARTQRVTNVKNAGGGAVIFHNSAAASMTPTDNHPLPTVHMLHEVGNPLKDYIVANPGKVKVSITRAKARYAGQDFKVIPRMMASFSSRGPNSVAEDIIKPDITAPGISILAGASPVHVGTAEQNQLFQAIMGTSMSSPHVAGIFALIKQAHPDWSPAMAKSALMTSASGWVLQDDGFGFAEPFDAGTGHVDVSPVDRNSAFSPGLVYDAGHLDYLGFLCSEAPEIFLDPEGTCNELASMGIPLDPSDLNLPSIGIASLPGSQTVVRTVTNVSDTSDTFFAWPLPPEGFTVTVEPRLLSLGPGESASFSVTITNVDAPIDEWKFGSLSWWSLKNASKYKIKSPIAVRASLFDAPEEISGSGETGSVDVVVRFGYTGAYTAAAHGLQPARISSATVVQDPDQIFNPYDGFSNSHRFDLSGAALLRVTLPTDSTEPGADLDIFVFDPDGNIAAFSANNATDELVDIQYPADGIWTVYVHGWSTPGGDSDYNMYSWILSAAPGGNLTINSAPDSATAGESGTIKAGWADTATGEWHLGAVSHAGTTGAMGLTVINLDNR